jgi:hypothetical protein
LWHIAGVRAYVACGIPIYALDLNVPRLDRLIANPRRFDPDALARKPRAAVYRRVSQRTVIGDGDTRIELYPVRGHGDERMLMAFLPGRGLLYGSSNDIGAGTTQPTFNAFELVDRVEALRIPVTDYIAIHTAKMPWSRFRSLVRSQPVLSGKVDAK